MSSENLPQKINAQAPITFADLIKDEIEAFKNDKEKELLYKAPVAQWIKKHPYATKKITTPDGGKQEVAADYLPIDKVEFLLDRIFQKWRVEVLSAVAMFNAISVTVRVHYRELDGEWTFHDGVGAQQLQVKKGTSFADLNNLNNGAVQMALPIAKSYAIKDACDHIGPIFGRNINRADADYAFAGSYSNPKPEMPKSDEKEDERLLALINACKSISTLEKFKNDLKNSEQREAYDKKFKELKK